jgi:hypothetical protein
VTFSFGSWSVGFGAPIGTLGRIVEDRHEDARKEVAPYRNVVEFRFNV